ncbi:MAG: methyltransferase, partial [Campylobacterota bacterium]|nr:methyltransferase [Campylobacterota bacterium]
MKSFTTQSMQEIFIWLKSKNDPIISFEVINPDLSEHNYAGNILTCKSVQYRHHSYKAWSDLGEIL